MFGLPQLSIGEVETTGVDDNFTLAIDTSAITAWTPRHLIFHIRAKQATGNLPVIGLQFNGDTADHYQWYRSQGSGTSTADATAYGGSSASPNQDVQVSRMEVGYAQETNWTHVVGMVVDAFSTRCTKTIRWMSYMPEESGTTGHIYQGIGKWESTAIITSVELDAAENVDAGSRIELAVVDESYNIDETILASNASSKSANDANDGAFNTNNTGAISAGNGDLCMVGNFRFYQERQSFLAFNDDFSYTSHDPKNYWTSFKNAASTGAWGAIDDDNESGQGVHSTAYAAGHPNEDKDFCPNIAFVPDYATATHDRGAMSLSGEMYNYQYGIAAYGGSRLHHVRWNNTDAITEWQMDSGFHTGTAADFVTGSMCSFYKVTDDYNLIERKEITTDTAYFDVTIPDTYDHIEVTWTARSDVAGAGSILMGEMSQYLGDSGGVDTTDTNYANRIYRFKGGNYSTVDSTGSYTGGANMGEVATTDADANVFSTGWNMIFDYNESVHKTSIGIGGVVENSDAYATCGYKATSWHDNDAVTTLRIQAATGDLVSGSVFSIRGVQASLPADTFVPSVVMF